MEEVGEWLKKALAESDNEAKLRDSCIQKFGDSLSDLRVSFGTSFRVANLYLRGQKVPVSASIQKDL